MKRTLPLVGTLLLTTGTVFAAAVSTVSSNIVVKTSVHVVAADETNAVTGANQKTPTGAEILKGLMAVPATERAEIKTKMEQGKQQFAMIKALVALQGEKDPAQKEQLALAEESMDGMIELLGLIGQADAAVAAGDTKKADEANKAAAAKADALAKLQDRITHAVPAQPHSHTGSHHGKKPVKTKPVTTPAAE